MDQGPSHWKQGGPAASARDNARLAITEWGFRGPRVVIAGGAGAQPTLARVHRPVVAQVALSLLLLAALLPSRRTVTLQPMAVLRRE